MSLVTFCRWFETLLLRYSFVFDSIKHQLPQVRTHIALLCQLNTIRGDKPLRLLGKFKIVGKTSEIFLLKYDTFANVFPLLFMCACINIFWLGVFNASSCLPLPMGRNFAAQIKKFLSPIRSVSTPLPPSTPPRLWRKYKSSKNQSTQTKKNHTQKNTRAQKKRPTKKSHKWRVTTTTD